jgi:hypothetical protein
MVNWSLVKQHKHGDGGQKAQARRDMVNQKQHKHGCAVKKHKEEETLSGSTSLEMGLKST